MDDHEMEHSTYARQLQSELRWDPTSGAEGESKQVFVEALTAIAALPSDSLSMEIRRLLVQDAGRGIEADVGQEIETSEQQNHLRNVIAALSARDVQLKCKAANAVGSLCISRVAGQMLLDRFGHEVLKGVSKMAMCRSQWAQGDAFFVLGWMVVVADEEMLQTIGELLPSVVKSLRRNVRLLVESGQEDEGGKGMAAHRSRLALASSEQASNFRVYGLVLLLNFSQRQPRVFEDQLERLLPMVKELVEKLLDSAPPSDGDIYVKMFLEPSEYAELLRLTITLLSVLVGQLEGVAPLLLELKMLPLLLKLKRVLASAQHELIGDTEDITETLEALIETLLGSR